MSSAKIAIEYEGRLYNLKTITPIVAKRLSEKPIGITRDFLVLAAILKKKYNDLDTAIDETLKYMLDGSDVINSIVLGGIVKGLRKLGIRAREGSIEFEDEESKKKLDELLEKVHTVTLEVIEAITKPRTRAEALQTYVSLVEDAEIRISIGEV